jgi:molybdenum ABC transporter molybdate-binding protein
MFARLSPPLVAFGASLLLFGALIAALFWTHDSSEPLEIYCAEAMRVPLEAVAKEYEQEIGQKVVLHVGPSQTILSTLELRKKGDLFLPADDSYVRDAKKKGIVSAVFDLARMKAVVVVRPNFPHAIKTWNDFIAKENKIGLANVQAAAIGKLMKQYLQGTGRWDSLEKHQPKYMGNVNEVANGVRLGSVDVGIVWDVIAQPHPDLTVVHLPELAEVQAHVQMALLTFSTQPNEARRFVRYLRANNKGAPHLKKQGYSDVIEDESMDGRPELVVYAGSMLRPALEESIKEFEIREHVRIIRVYNGCGILVAQMDTGETPDVYFSCDTRFMKMVKDKFDNPTTVSTNQLVIAVRKGNPKQILSLDDLGKPGLRVGVGHENQCALGALTKETFIEKKVYEKVRKNVVVESPTGDLLINQLRAGDLDAVVAYRSNVKPFENELEGIPVENVPCAIAQQPIAISKNSAHPKLSQKLMEFLRQDESRRRFEKLGFGWELKEIEKK